jgi:large subunit ribosomal protein L23
MKAILRRPVLTEKMTDLQTKMSRYAFEVDPDANKIEIAKAVEKKFRVTVIKVHTVWRKGKRKEQLTRRGRFEGRTSRTKRAIVTLKADEKIDFFETGV